MKIGDKVVMNDKFYVSEENKGRVWTVRSEPWKCSGTLVVLLDGKSDGYAVDGLDIIEEAESNHGENTLTADAPLVKHGYWDDRFDGITPVCSVCRMTHHEYIRCPDYCPHCNAKMDGKEYSDD